MKRKDGHPRNDYDFELDELILDFIYEKGQVSIDDIRISLNKVYGRKLGWATIKRHIDRLLEQKEIIISYQSEEGKKINRLYKIRDSNRIVSIK